jgi:2-haloacid dehalogenase
MPDTAPAPAPVAATLGVRACVFDIFGTVVDWHGSVARDAAAFAARHGVPLDAGAFALAWRAGYQPAMQQVRSGELPWTSIDGLHRRILDGLWPRFGLPADVPEAERDALNRAWHRLDPWPDVPAGLAALRRARPCATLSNGNVSLLVDLARHGGYDWDAVFSAELFGHYKPDPEVYLGACRLFDLPPHAVLMVAAHPSDLRAAAAAGLRTAYIPRPAEHGAGGPMEAWTAGEFDVVADGLGALAERLGP